MIYWTNRLVKILAGNAAKKFLEKAGSGDETATQFLMAKATGNFKRGNERNFPKDYEKEVDNARSVSG